MVDILRGVKPIQIDFEELRQIANVLKMSKTQLFNMWKKRMLEYLKEGGFNLEKNKNLIEKMFESAEKYTTKES